MILGLVFLIVTVVLGILPDPEADLWQEDEAGW